VLTFYRGQWCPFCNLTLRAYQRILPQIRALGASLVAVSPQTPEHSLSTVEKKELTFTVLSDVGNSVARKYRLVFTLEQPFRTLYTSIGADLPSFNGDPSWELPMPATFLLAQDGTVRLAFVEEDFTHRLEPATLLAGLRALLSNGPMKEDQSLSRAKRSVFPNGARFQRKSTSRATRSRRGLKKASVWGKNRQSYPGREDEPGGSFLSL
jgi:peroxiredoxin